MAKLLLLNKQIFHIGLTIQNSIVILKHIAMFAIYSIETS